jgi:hypothetical protein
LLPLLPDVIVSHSPPLVTDAVHDIVPVPVFDTLKLVLPVSLATDRLLGVTDSTVCTGAPA